MKTIAFMVACLVAQPAIADWYFVSSLDGGEEYWTFTNDTGDVSPRRQKSNEIWITRNPQGYDLGSGGACTEYNCSLSVAINGHVPAANETVKVLFSNDVTMTIKARDGQTLLENSDPTGVASMDRFTQNVRAAGWVEISFGEQSHHFDLSGSSKAWNAYRTYKDVDIFKRFGG